MVRGHVWYWKQAASNETTVIDCKEFLLKVEWPSPMYPRWFFPPWHAKLSRRKNWFSATPRACIFACPGLSSRVPPLSKDKDSNSQVFLPTSHQQGFPWLVPQIYLSVSEQEESNWEQGLLNYGRDMSKPSLIKSVLFALLESASVVWTFQETLLWPRPGRHSQSWRLTKRLTKRDFTKCCGQMQAGYDRLPICLFILSIYVNQSISWFGYGHAAHLKTLLVRNQSAFGKCAKALWQIHYFMIRK